MEMITGNGVPSKHLVGAVGQYYKDLNTGDIYECKCASKFSILHREPVGGYVWKKIARGEHMNVCAGGSGGAKHFAVKCNVDETNYTANYEPNMTYEELRSALASGEPCYGVVNFPESKSQFQIIAFMCEESCINVLSCGSPGGGFNNMPYMYMSDGNFVEAQGDG